MKKEIEKYITSTGVERRHSAIHDGSIFSQRSYDVVGDSAYNAMSYFYMMKLFHLSL